MRRAGSCSSSLVAAFLALAAAACDGEAPGRKPAGCKASGCPAGNYCDTPSGACRPGCAAHSQCGPLEVCDLAAHRCVPLSDDEEDALLMIGEDPGEGSCRHSTAAEPDTCSVGRRIGAAFQLARCQSGGAYHIGFAISTDDGESWRSGTIPLGLIQLGSDPTIAYSEKHATWIVNWLGAGGIGNDLSTDDGKSWTGPFWVPGPSGLTSDKNWIACDNFADSPGYGNCYTAWTDTGADSALAFSRSTDGGNSWSSPQHAGGLPTTGTGAQVLVQPNGRVVVPYLGSCLSGSTLWCVTSVVSENQGQSWVRPALDGQLVLEQTVPGGIRLGTLPSAELDRSGKVYAAWHDCAFRSGCEANDLVLSTSADGVNWTEKTRIPLPTAEDGESPSYFIPGIGVDVTTDGASAVLGVAYLYYPNNSCDFSTCLLHVGFVKSTDGGATWSPPVHLAGPMNLDWLPETSNPYGVSGRFLGDYLSTSFSSTHRAFPAFPVARSSSGLSYALAIYTARGGL